VIYSTSPSPVIAHAVLKSIDLIESPDGLQKRSHLFDLIAFWTEYAHFKKWNALPSSSAIQPILIGGNAQVVHVSEALRQHHIWVPAIRPPTVPLNTGRLRITLNADHSLDHLKRLLDTLHQIEEDE
jgi:8-amino-7-oxononanoate synthase